MVAGLAILANSRPNEGLLASLPAVLALPYTWRHKGYALHAVLTRTVLPLGFMLGIIASLMAFYNYRVTGRWLHLPYQAHEEAYSPVPLFLFVPLRAEPVYHNKIMQDFFARDAVDHYKQERTRFGLASSSVDRTAHLWKFYLGLVLTTPFLFLPWVQNNWSIRLIQMASIIPVLILLMGP